VLNKLGTPKTCTFSGLVGVDVVTDVVNVVVVVVVAVIVELVIVEVIVVVDDTVTVVEVVFVVVDVVVQSPSAYSSSFVLAPAMQVPAGLPLVVTLLHPHAPVQSIPHLIKLHGSTPMVDAVVVVVTF
jgi:hypothetical protein